MYCTKCGKDIGNSQCPVCGTKAKRLGVGDVIWILLWLIGIPVKLFVLVLSIFVPIPGVHRSYRFRDLLLGSKYVKSQAKVSIVMNAVFVALIVLVVLLLGPWLWALLTVSK